MNPKKLVASPSKVGVIHIIGIGGIGMSGIAEILHIYGYSVQGTDLSNNYVIDRLIDMGIKITLGHAAVNVENASIVVKSTAVKDSNPELIAAAKLNIPILKRSEMLAELMRFKNPIAISGTHGKTTTTSIIGSMIAEAGLDPTIINGGIINKLGSNVSIGEGDLMVVEADESDGTFIRVPAYISVITNIDPEHLDYYGNFDNAKAAYLQFMENIPFYGYAVTCFDHPVVRELSYQVMNRKLLSYGMKHKADVMATKTSVSSTGCYFDLHLSDLMVGIGNVESNHIKDFFLPLHGDHNIQNCLAAITVGLALEIPIEIIKKSFANFAGVKRRFTKTGEVDDILIIDDYAHHPAEIKATLLAASQVAKLREGSIVAVLQPHRYSRLQLLMEEFSTSVDLVDHLIVADVYPAGEIELPGVNSLELIKKIKTNANIDAIYLDDHKKIAEVINNIAKSKDLVVFLGAGSITQWAYDLPASLAKLKGFAQ
jgi:UDP-N-acetylmuramate--alanine ligase